MSSVPDKNTSLNKDIKKMSKLSGISEEDIQYVLNLYKLVFLDNIRVNKFTEYPLQKFQLPFMGLCYLEFSPFRKGKEFNGSLKYNGWNLGIKLKRDRKFTNLVRDIYYGEYNPLSEVSIRSVSSIIHNKLLEVIDINFKE